MQRRCRFIQSSLLLSPAILHTKLVSAACIGELFLSYTTQMTMRVGTQINFTTKVWMVLLNSYTWGSTSLPIQKEKSTFFASHSHGLSCKLPQCVLKVTV